MKFPEYFTDDCFLEETADAVEKKIEALILAMTNEEKAGLCHGGINPPEVGPISNGGYIGGVTRQGVPEIPMYDGRKRESDDQRKLSARGGGGSCTHDPF